MARVARFKAGSFLLAIEAGLPIVPLTVIGTRHVMPKGRLRTEPGDVELIVHDPIVPPTLAVADAFAMPSAWPTGCTRSWLAARRHGSVSRRRNRPAS